MRLSEEIERVLSRWSLRLISLHTHSASHSSHAHRLLLLLLLLLELLLLELWLLLHATHAHWLELSHHWLETTSLGGWSVERITVLLMCHAVTALVQQLAEGVSARQVALRLELILLTKVKASSCGLLLLLVFGVETLKDRVFVIIRELVLCWGQWLVICSEDIVKLVTLRLLIVATRCNICWEYVQKVASDIIIVLSRRCLIWLHLHLWLLWLLLCRCSIEGEEVISCLAWRILACQATFALIRWKIERRWWSAKQVTHCICGCLLLCAGGRGAARICGRYRWKVSSIDHFEETEVLIHLELFSRISYWFCACIRGCFWFRDAIESITIEVLVGDRVKILSLPFLELLAVHTRAQLWCNLVHLGWLLCTARYTLASLRHHNAESIDKTALRIVKVW